MKNKIRKKISIEITILNLEQQFIDASGYVPKEDMDEAIEGVADEEKKLYINYGIDSCFAI